MRCAPIRPSCWARRDRLTGQEWETRGGRRSLEGWPSMDGEPSWSRKRVASGVTRRERRAWNVNFSITIVVETAGISLLLIPANRGHARFATSVSQDFMQQQAPSAPSEQCRCAGLPGCSNSNARRSRTLSSIRTARADEKPCWIREVIERSDVRAIATRICDFEFQDAGGEPVPHRLLSAGNTHLIRVLVCALCSTNRTSLRNADGHSPRA